jgi:hypothetical protein
MRLVNETGQQVAYWIQNQIQGVNSGEIAIDGYVDLPDFDNQSNVYVSFNGTGGSEFAITCTDTGTDQQVEMALIAEAGDSAA